MRFSIRPILFSATLAIAVSAATLAVAAPAAWESVDVTRHSDQSNSVILVAGELPQATPLPAEAEFDVPAGTELQWVGEILGGSPDADPELKYSKSTADGIDRYRVVLNTSRIAQIEVVVPEGQTFDGTAFTSTVDWTAVRDAAEVRLNIRVPQAATIARPVDGATLVAGDAGYSFFTKTFTDVKAGDRLALAAVYTLPAAAGADTSSQQGTTSGSVVAIVLVLAAAAAAAGITMGVRRKLAAKAGEVTRPADAGEQASDDAEYGEGPIGEGRDGEADDGPDLSENRGMSSSLKRNLSTGAIIVVLVIAAVAVGSRSTRPQAIGDTISQTFSAGEPCETAQIPVANAGDPEDTAKRLFAALGTMTGLNAATYNIKTQSIEVGYCESQTSEDAVRRVLQSTGLVAVGGSTVATPTP